MKTNSGEQFVALRAALQQEKANLEARLAEMTKALGASGAATPVVTTAPGKRHFSASDQGEDGCCQRRNESGVILAV